MTTWMAHGRHDDPFGPWLTVAVAEEVGSGGGAPSRGDERRNSRHRSLLGLGSGPAQLRPCAVYPDR